MSGAGIDRYGVMGYPISHSRSPVIHRLFALQTEQDLQYELLPVEPEDLSSAVRDFQQSGGKGLNVTVPHKAAVADLMDTLSERARSAGAVNTILFDEHGLTGDNTDGVGLMRDLHQNLGLTIQGADILILGAGGATRGIIGPLLEAQAGSVMIANRTLEKAEDLVSRFSSLGPVYACRFDDVPRNVHYSLVINATSAGLTGKKPPYPKRAISDTTFCYDLSYGLNATPFSQWAAAQGAARSVMGWGMLVEQAAESFYLWRGVRPKTESVLRQLKISA